MEILRVVRFRLSDKQEFAVLREGPHFVLHDELELVDVVAYGVEVGRDFVVVGDGQFADVLNLVDHLALLYHLLHVLGDEAGNDHLGIA